MKARVASHLLQSEEAHNTGAPIEGSLAVLVEVSRVSVFRIKISSGLGKEQAV
jgi:hypothetical protein